MKAPLGLLLALSFLVPVAGTAAWVCVTAASPIITAKDLEGETIALNALKSSSENLLFEPAYSVAMRKRTIRVLSIPMHGPGNEFIFSESLAARDLLPELDNGYKFGLLPRAVAPSEMLVR